MYARFWKELPHVDYRGCYMHLPSFLPDWLPDCHYSAPSQGLPPVQIVSEDYQDLFHHILGRLIS